MTCRASNPATARRAFTLLEVVLAATIASIVLVVALGMMSSWELADRRLQDRTVEARQLARVQMVLDRVFTSLVAAEVPQVSRSGAVEAKAESAFPAELPEERPKDARDARARDESIARQAAMVAPRFVLDQDPMARGLPPGPGAPAARPDRRTMGRPQRFEVVLAEAPVPEDDRASDAALARALLAGSELAAKRVREQREARAGARDKAPPAVAPGSRDADEEDEPEVVVRALRGVFMLTPAADRLDGRSPLGEGRAMSTFLAETEQDRARARRAWDLWWVPLKPRQDPGEVEPGARAPRSTQTNEPLHERARGAPVLIASDIAFMNWRVFQGRKKHDAYEGRFWRDLPAYIEVTIETVGGLRGDWLFEIGPPIIGAEATKPSPKIDMSEFRRAGVSTTINGRVIEARSGGDGK